jgi:hypothetical protein
MYFTIFAERNAYMYLTAFSSKFTRIQINPCESNKNAWRGTLPANELKTLPWVCLCDCSLHRCFYYPIYNECLNKGSFKPQARLRRLWLAAVYSIITAAHRLDRK